MAQVIGDSGYPGRLPRVIKEAKGVEQQVCVSARLHVGETLRLLGPDLQNPGGPGRGQQGREVGAGRGKGLPSEVLMSHSHVQQPLVGEGRNDPTQGIRLIRTSQFTLPVLQEMVEHRKREGELSTLPMEPGGKGLHGRGLAPISRQPLQGSLQFHQR